MIVVTRFDVPQADAPGFLDQARLALAAFAARPGYVRGRVGRAADDATAWVMTTEWLGVGAYRRSLSAYDVKVGAAPLLAQGRDEPGAFEVLLSDDAAQAATPERDGGGMPAPRSDRAADADTAGIGRSSGPAVSDLPAGS